MAFIDNQNDLENPEVQAQGQGPLVGQGSSAVSDSQGGTGQAAGIGAGGSGWTNIQAYLNANQSDTGSAQNLNDKVGNQFQTEKDNYTNESNQLKQDAQSKVDSGVTTDQAKGYLDQASKQYQYADYTPEATLGGVRSKPGQTDPASQYRYQPLALPTYDTNGYDSYGNIKGKVQNALSDTYTGPTSYSYGLGDKTQTYGSDLKDNAGFDTLMNGLYSERANKPLTSGQYALQKQLDVNNSALKDARQNLSGQYDNLIGGRDQVVGDTSSALSKASTDFRNNQQSLMDFLNSEKNTADTSVSTLENQAKAAYAGNQQQQSGLKSAVDLNSDDLGFTPAGGGRTRDVDSTMRDQGLAGNLNYAQLEKELGMKDSGALYDTQFDDPMYSNYWGGASQKLGQFYNQQDANAYGAGDLDKRRYNTVLDFLNSSTPTKQAGFSVRGE